MQILRITFLRETYKVIKEGATQQPGILALMLNLDFNNMKKILIVFITVFTLVSCEKDITNLNIDKKHPAVAPPEPIFANAQRNLSDILATPNVNSGIFRLLSQHWTETTYFDESRYDLTTRNIPQNFYAAVYRDVLRDLNEVKILIPVN